MFQEEYFYTIFFKNVCQLIDEKVDAYEKTIKI